MHPANPHKDSYDLKSLIVLVPALRDYIIKNKSQKDSIDFADPKAVHLLNEALLKGHHGITKWNNNHQSLIPAVPGRCDHLLYLRDFLMTDDLQSEEKPTILDIGTGANCIYPILGISLFDWNFIASESNQQSYKSASQIKEDHPDTLENIDLRFQPNDNHIFKGIILPTDKITATICNPPFYSSKEESQKVSLRKSRRLKQIRNQRNFRGLDHELWYPGGEYAFVKKMIDESTHYNDQVSWFSSLISKETNLKRLIRYLNRKKIFSYKVIEFSHGNKKSRILAWKTKGLI